jgi:Ner family transcriptional regulator
LTKRRRLAGRASRGFKKEDNVASTASGTWDRHAILAAIKRRYGSLTGLAERYETDRRHLTVALRRPYLKAEGIIAKALGVPASELWPDRYGDAASARRKRATAAPASQPKNSTRQNERAA